MLAPDNTLTHVQASNQEETGTFFSKWQCSGDFHNSAVHGTAQMQVRLKLQLNFRITCNVATQDTSNEGQAMHNIIFPDEFSMQ
jgi:hypothetical protein